MKTNIRLVLLLLTICTVSIAGEEERVINNEAEIRLRIEVEQEVVIHACEARLELEYYQKGSEVHVESLLTNEVCDASTGSYVIQVRYRGDDGKQLNKEFAEGWARSDGLPIEGEKRYFVADDVDIISVRSRKLRCKCAEQPAINE